MHQGYDDLETIIEDEFLDDHFEHERISDDNYGIKFDESYHLEIFEPDKAIEELQEIPIESGFNEPAITEIQLDVEILWVLPTNHPKNLRYLDPK